MFDYSKDESNSIVLVDVPVRKIFSCKNPGYKVVSIDYDKSENGYGNVVLNANNIKDKGNGFCDAYIGEKGMWREISIRQNNGYYNEKMPLEDMLALFNKMKQKEANQINKAFESRAKQQQNNNQNNMQNNYSSNVVQSNSTRHNVFLNNVSTNRIRPAKNGGDFSSVFLAYENSDDGYLRLPVSNKFIFNKGGNSNTRNINLGYNDRFLNCSVLKNGKFEKIQMKAEDIAALDVENTKKFEAKKNKSFEATSDVSHTDLKTNNSKVFEEEPPFEFGFNFESELTSIDGVKVVTEEELFVNDSVENNLVDAKDELDSILGSESLVEENIVEEPVKENIVENKPEVNNTSDFDILSDLESMYGRDDYVEEDDYTFY